MPRKKKKSLQEKTAEGFFPIGTDDLKKTVEKQERPEIYEAKVSVEKQYKGSIPNPVEAIKQTKVRRPGRSFKKPVKKMPFKKGRAANKITKKEKKIFPAKTFKPSKISLKSGGYELIITEKPQAASKIAAALGKETKQNIKGIPYYTINRQGKKLVVAPAVGHLFTLKQNVPGAGFPIFEIGWVPNYFVKKGDFSKKYYEALLSLAKDAGSLTVATDYDIEGEVIGLNIVRYVCGQQDASRMKFSTLTSKELNDAYESKSSTLNWGQAIAGETRHYLDWFYGINLSRALMQAIKSTGRFKIMSIGRVQGPTLNLIVQKEREIQAFKPVPYWQVFITVKNSHVLELKYVKDIFDKQELVKFDNIKGKTALAKTEKRQEILPPQPPFNLTTLQIEAYKFYGITPSRTLQIAQSLYLNGLISYPRTSSEKLPPSIAYKEILEKVAHHFKTSHLIKRDIPIEGKKTDPAHPSIYPTGNFQILSGDDEKVYSLIAKRFLSLFCEDAIIDKKKITAEVDGLQFATLGSAISKKAWLEIYPSKLKENEIPDLSGEVKIISAKTEEKETQPPRRYSPASILSELEKRNLGTKATRANILETLYDRGYIRGTSIESTPLGISLITTLEKYSPIIIDDKLTRRFEDSMEAIREAKTGLEGREGKIIDKAKKTITKILEDFVKNEKKIGQELIVAENQVREIEREENKIQVVCPKCKKGNLAIKYAKNYRRYFLGCDSYPDCTNTYSLPPNSLIKKSDKTCESCNFPMLMSIRKGKKPWIFCFNPECKTNRERIEKYKEKQEENQK